MVDYVERIVAAVWCSDKSMLVPCLTCQDCPSQHGYAFADGDPNGFGPICDVSTSGKLPVIVPDALGHEAQL